MVAEPRFEARIAAQAQEAAQSEPVGLTRSNTTSGGRSSLPRGADPSAYRPPLRSRYVGSVVSPLRAVATAF
eukprot:5510886-Amphidinium_carterae.1